MGENTDNLEIWVKISTQIGELQASVQSVLQQLVQHENRITALEQGKTGADRKDWRADLLMLLAKALLIGGVSIASLCGAGGLLQQILGK